MIVGGAWPAEGWLSCGQVPRRLGSFDTMLLLGGNMALLAGRDQARRHLARLRSVAAPGARLSVANREVTNSSDPHVRACIARNQAREVRLPLIAAVVL